MEILPTHDFVILHIGYLENRNPLNYTDLLNADTLHCTNKKILSANITMDLIRKVSLSIGKLLSSEGRCKFCKFYFCLKTPILLLETDIAKCFP